MGDKPTTSTTPIRSSSSHPAVIPTAPRPRTCGFGRSPQIPQCLLLLQFFFLKISLQNRMCGKSSGEHRHPSHSPRQARKRGRDTSARFTRTCSPCSIFRSTDRVRYTEQPEGRARFSWSGRVRFNVGRLCQTARRQIQHPLSRINADEADRDHGTGRGQIGRWSWRV